jgi:hypothetical protein
MGLISWIKELGKKKRIRKLYQSTFSEPDVPRESVGGTTYIQWASNSTNDSTSSTTPNTIGYAKVVEKQEDKRAEVKPKDVVGELNSTDEIKINFENLEAKIKVIKKRYKFMKEDMQLAARDEEMAIKYLEAALRYRKMGGKGFAWEVTTQKKIDELRSKYKVTVGSLGSYHRTVPQEAVDEMEKYLKIFRKVTNGEEPDVKLIVDDIVERPLDPIIIAGSPFGPWFYVLGAWDKEIEIMGELFMR